MVVDAEAQLKEVVNLIKKLKPEYLLVSRRYGENHYRYVFKTIAFMAAVRDLKPSFETHLIDFLNLHEYHSDSSLKFAGDPKLGLEAIEQHLPSNRFPAEMEHDFIIIGQKDNVIGIVDAQRGLQNPTYCLKGISYTFRPNKMAYLRGTQQYTQRQKMEEFQKREAGEKALPRKGEYSFRSGRLELPRRSTPKKLKGTASHPAKRPEKRKVLERFPTATLPDRVKLNQTIPLEIMVKIKRPEQFKAATGLIIEPHSGEKEIPLLVIVKPGSFELEEDNYCKTLLVPVEAVDSKPIIFMLKAMEEGWQTIKIEFVQNGNYLGELFVGTLVGKFDVSMPKSVDAKWTLGEMPEGPDLTVYVFEKKAGTEFEYDICLISQKLGIPIEKYGPIRFAGDPEYKFRTILQEIENLNGSPSVITSSLKAKGMSLYDELFPDKLKNRYWQIRDQIVSVQIVSEEPWVPWEIVRPWRRLDGDIEEDRFLSERYSFSRWLEGHDVKVKGRLGTAKVVVPKDTNLSNALAELNWIQKFAGKIKLDVSRDSEYDEVFASLRTGGFDLLHFSTHGRYDPAYPYLSGILLENGIELKPEHVSGLATKFGQNNPVVVLNACQTGSQGFALTGIGSWAKQFLDAGASAFIGTLWSVSDDCALEFTQQLYQNLGAGSSLGEAVREARIHCSKLSGDPSWLAYELYGQPNTRIALGR
jgi:hypothetical protein